jgi:hypothetical protein
VSGRLSFRREDLFVTPLREADVLTLYLLPEINLRLRPRILAEMRPGTRVVSHDFNMGDWPSDGRAQVGTATTYLWIVPARIAGRWTFTQGATTAVLDIQQQYQNVLGTALAAGETARLEQGRLTGADLRFLVDLGEGRREFTGRVEGDTITGTGANAGWRATRID